MHTHTPLHITTRFSCCAAVAAIVLSSLAMPRTDPRVASHSQDDPAVSLKRITETRLIDLAKPAEDGMFTMSSDKPALTLTFTLTTPPGARIMDIQQPKAVQATDSAGTNLSEIEAGFRGEREYVELAYDFDEDDNQSDFTLKLLPSSRAAQSFSVSTTFSVSMFTATKPTPIEVGKDWTPLNIDPADFNKPVRLRLRDDGLELQPSEIERLIESIEMPAGDGQSQRANGWFSDGRTITYLFDSIPEQRPLKFTMMLRTGIRTAPITVELKDHALP